MGGRGTSSIRRSERGFTEFAKSAGVGGGGEVIGAAGNKITVGGVEYDIVSMSYTGGTHTKPNTRDGQLVLRDASGKTLKSIQVSSGSTRVTYEFENFAVKVEGFHKSNFGGQNKAEQRAYDNVQPRLKGYVTRILSPNRELKGTIGARGTPFEAIAVERVVPFKGNISKDYDRLARQFDRLVENKGGKRLYDLRLPDPDNQYGHNVYIIQRPNGRLQIKAFDIPYGK